MAGEAGQSAAHPHRVVAFGMAGPQLGLPAAAAVQHVLPGGVGMPAGLVEAAPLHERGGTNGGEPFTGLSTEWAPGSTHRHRDNALATAPLSRTSRLRRLGRRITAGDVDGADAPR